MSAASTTNDAAGSPRPAARLLAPLLEALAPNIGVRIELWDGSVAGRDNGPILRLRSPDAIRRLLWAPGELGLGRAYVAGDIEIDGDIFEAIAALRPAGTHLHLGARQLVAIATAARNLGAVGRRLAPPPEETRPRGVAHSERRDAKSVGHHYDVGNEFYRLVLGHSMTYSCARFSSDGMSLADAQESKHDLVCRKLGIHERPALRLLDVGCGWGSMAIHAATRYGARVVGITISREQHAEGKRRVARAGASDLVEIRLQDYRDIGDEEFDAVSSIGMSEHVGRKRIDDYFSNLSRVLAPNGRLLNHAISSVGGSRLGRRSFMGRYVFPDGELLDVADTAVAMERAGFEVRDIESLREHYALTLRSWIANLDEHWNEAVALVGERRARVWRLYMAASTVGFEDGGVSVHQVLGVVPGPAGASGMPRTRDRWTTEAHSTV